MNEEEKKALRVINARTRRLLDELEIEKEDMSDEPRIAYLMQEIRANKTILNLIEKLLKENEQLRTEVNSLKKENEELNEKILDNAGIYQLGFKDGEESYIKKVKDKIRKNEEIIDISNDGDLIHELYQKNKVYEELLESEK